jgi:PGF-pre-PGF domain-containing protein
LVSKITTEDNISEVKVSGNYAYLADGKNGLLIFDISNLSSPILLGNYNNTSGAFDISDNYMFVPARYNGLFDISGNFMYVAAGYNGLLIFDISNPSSPVLKGSYDIEGYASGVSVSGNYAYIVNSSEFLIFDISNPSSPVLKGSYDTLFIANDVSVAGNYAYLVGFEDLLIFDISNPSSPILLGNYSKTIVDFDAIDPWMATDVLVSGNYVYVADGHGDFSIFDIGNPSSPYLKGSYNAGAISDFSVSGDYVYIASYYNGLYILKTNLEQTPLPIADFDTNPSYGRAPLLIQFKDRSGNTNEWNWNFGDETSSNEQNPKHTYSKPGTYRVSLLVSNENGISYPVTRVIYVFDSNLPPFAMPNLLPVADFSTNVTSDLAPLSVQFTDLSKDAKLRIWYFGDGESSNETNPTHVYAEEGTYTVILTASNENGNASKNTTITVQNRESSHTSSGSGGGSAGSSPEPQSNVEVKELSQAFVASGKSVKFDFPQKVTVVESISFDSKKTAGKTSTIVEMLKGKSTLVSGLPSGEVYKYLNIWVGNGGFGDSNNIVNSVINLKVEKTWIQDQNIDHSLITLYRYNDQKWNSLPTNLSGEDDKYLYFTAKTSGFSHFAITGKITASGTTRQTTTGNKTESAVNDTQNNALNTTIKTNQTPEKTQVSDGFGKKGTKTPDFEIATGIVCLLSIFLYKRR